jgi:iron complex outermembrane receptor protein
MHAASKIRVIAFTLMAGAAPVTALHAQDAATAATPPSDDAIIILGRGLALPPGTPAYGAVTIDRDSLVEAPSGMVENALSGVAGLQQFRRSDSRSANASSQGVTLRALGGNASSRALVLLDGVPQADPFFGSIPFTAFDASALGAVRVTRGGGAGAFGAGAVSGTIEMFSADRAQLPHYAGSAYYGSRNAQELNAAFSPDIGGGFISVSGQYSRGDGFYMSPAAQRGAGDAPARYENWSVGLRGVAPVGADGEIQTRLTIFRDDRTIRFAGQDSGTEGQDASLRFLWRGDWQVEALAYAQFRNFNNVVISSSSFKPTLNQRNTPATGLGGKIELRPPVGPDNVLRLGMDSRYAQADMFEDAFTPTSCASVDPFSCTTVTARRDAAGQQVTTGFYLEDDWTLGRVVVSVGARADRWTISKAHLIERTGAGAINSANTVLAYPNRDGWEGSFRGGLLWHASPAIDLRVAGYTSFRLPTLNELYRSFAVSASGVTTRTVANAALGPERLKGAEVGFDIKPLPGVHFSATAFYNRLGNAIGNVTTGLNVRQRQNLDAIVAKGVELSGSVKLGDFDLDASYAYSDSHVKASGAAAALNTLRPAQSPQNMASATLAWTAPYRVRVAGTVRYTGSQFEDDLQTDTLPSTTTFDGYVRVPIGKKFGIVGRVENAFNETILTRKVTTNGIPSVDLGTPRTFWIGLTFGG